MCVYSSPSNQTRPSPSQILRSSPSKNLLPAAIAAAAAAFEMNRVLRQRTHQRLQQPENAGSNHHPPDSDSRRCDRDRHRLQGPHAPIHVDERRHPHGHPRSSNPRNHPPWLSNPGPPDEDLAGALRRPVGATTIAICFVGAVLIFVPYYLLFY